MCINEGANFSKSIPERVARCCSRVSTDGKKFHRNGTHNRYSKRTTDWCWDNKALRGFFRRQQLFVRVLPIVPGAPEMVRSGAVRFSARQREFFFFFFARARDTMEKSRLKLNTYYDSCCM